MADTIGNPASNYETHLGLLLWTLDILPLFREINI